MKSFEYYKPDNIQEASELLVKFGEEASILNGGTDLIVRMRDYVTSPKAVVDIKGIKTLHQIECKENEIYIGACVKLSEIQKKEFIRDKLPFFVQAISTIASGQVRNRATCVGNICNASPLADTATPLLSLNATIHIYSPDSPRDILLSDLFVFVRKTSLKVGEIATGITIPIEQGVEGAYKKISRRKEVDLSTVCSTVVKVKDDYRISYGAVAPTPIRLTKTEAFLSGRTLTKETIEEACDIAVGEVSPISDIRASKEYRKEMVRVALRENLKKWL